MCVTGKTVFVQYFLTPRWYYHIQLYNPLKELILDWLGAKLKPIKIKKSKFSSKSKCYYKDFNKMFQNSNSHASGESLANESNLIWWVYNYHEVF